MGKSFTSPHRELIRKYISGKCTEAERRKVVTLLAQPEYQSLFEDILGEQGNPIMPSHDDADERLKRWTEKIRQRIAQHERGGPEHKTHWRSPSFYRYAALWIFALSIAGGLGYLTFTVSARKQIAYTEKHNDGTAPLHLILEDSSVVILGPGSKLRYPETFSTGSRNVLLDGEAFFRVRRDVHRPFLVNSGDVRTTVLGTSFKVTAFPGRPTCVAVATGKVRVDQVEDNNPEALAVLTPGRQLMHAHGKTVQSEVSIQQLVRWQEGRLIYRNTPLRHITEDLERWYGIQVRYREPIRADVLLDMNLVASLPLERTLRILAATADFTYEQYGNIVTIND